MMVYEPTLQAAIDRQWPPELGKRRVGLEAFTLGWEAASKGYSKVPCPYSNYRPTHRQRWMDGYEASVENMRLEGKLEYILLSSVAGVDRLELITQAAAVIGTFERIQNEVPQQLTPNSLALPGELWIDLLDGDDGDLVGDPVIVLPQFVEDVLRNIFHAPEEVIEKAMHYVIQPASI